MLVGVGLVAASPMSLHYVFVCTQLMRMGVGKMMTGGNCKATG